VLHRPETFGRKHSLVAHRRQHNLSFQSTLSDGSGHRVKSIRVGSSHGSKVQTQFHLWYTDSVCPTLGYQHNITISICRALIWKCLTVCMIVLTLKLKLADLQ